LPRPPPVTNIGGVSVWRQIHDRVFDHRVLISLLALLGGVELWLLPDAMLRNGGGTFLLMWMFLVFVLATPIIFFEIAIGGSMAGTFSEGIRKASRRAEWLAWIGHVLALLGGVVAAAFCAWCLNLAFEAIPSLLGSSPPFVEVDSQATADAVRDRVLHDILGVGRAPASGILLRLGQIEPVGRTMVALGIVWFGVLWVVVRGISGFRHLARILLPIALALVLLNLVVQGSRFGAGAGIAHFLAPRWSVLLDLRAWTEATGLALLTVPVGIGIYAALAGVSLRQFDFAGAALISLAVNVLLHLLVLLALAAGFGAWAMGSQIRWATLDLPGPQAVLVGMAGSVCGQNDAPWIQALLLLFEMLPLLLLAFPVACSLLLSPLLAWARHRRQSLPRGSLTLAVVPVLLSLVFATSEGFTLWQGLVNCLRYLLLPLGVAVILRTGVHCLGAGALGAYITTHSAVRVGPAWRATVTWLFPVVLVAVALVAGIDHSLSHLDDPMTIGLFLLPLALVPAAAWVLQRFANPERR
jgi:NSS family neurotransmitter:Na+ symporter